MARGPRKTMEQKIEAKQELITLLIARRTLERSIVTWENQGQPEVYAQ